MIGDTVAIEIPETVSERDVGRALGACDAALGSHQCDLAGQREDADFTARVTQSQASELHIELVAAATGEVATVRVLKFSEDEPEAFRWQSVGVVVAALVLSQSGEEGEKPPSEPESPPPADQGAVEKPPAVLPETREVAPPPSPRPRELASFDLAPRVGSTATASGVAVGGWLSGAVRLRGALRLVAGGEVGFSGPNPEASDLKAFAAGGFLGLGLRAPFTEEWVGELWGGGALQGLSVRADTDEGVASTSTTRWGARAGSSVAWLPFDSWGFVLGGSAGVLWPPLDVQVVAGESVEIPALVWGGYLGVRIRLNSL